MVDPENGKVLAAKEDNADHDQEHDEDRDKDNDKDSWSVSTCTTETPIRYERVGVYQKLHKNNQLWGIDCKTTILGSNTPAGP